MSVISTRKRWHLFPPEDTPFLYPTRIPYEESSVFSKVNVVNPDVKRFPQFQKAQRHVVTLSSGQEEDHQARIEEAITRMLVCALKTVEDPHSTGAWLNPTEVEETSHEVNCRYLNRAVSSFFDHYRTSKTAEIQALRTNGEHTKKEEFDAPDLMEVEQTGSQKLTLGTAGEQAANRFGPDLVPVLPTSEAPPSETRGMFKNDGEGFVGKDGEHSDKLHCTKKQRMMSGCENEIVEQIASNSTMAPSQTFISTADLLDCLVNPQVTKIVAEGRSL